MTTSDGAPQWQACAQALLRDPRIWQINRAHASARPTEANPAWRNTHIDLGYVLRLLERCANGEFGEQS